MHLNDILKYFDKVKKIGTATGCKETYEALCPVHGDRTASLHISESQDGKVLMNCKAGCDTAEIMAAIGLHMSDLGDKPAQNWQSKLEEFVKKPLIDYYHYKNEAGRYLFTKLRFKEPDGSKDIRYGILDKQQDFMKLGKDGRKGTLYNLPALLKAVNDGFPVYLVEGEKDVETMRKLGLTAATAGGVKDWKKEFARYFIGARVIILPDNDEPGEKLADQIKRDLRDYAHSVKVVPTSTEKHGDVTDYVETGQNKDDLLKLIREVPAIVAPWIYFNEKDKACKNPKVNVGILAECIYKHNHIFIARKPGAESDLIYWYEEGVYRLLSRTELIGRVKQYLPNSLVVPNTLRNVADTIIYSCPTRGFSELNKSERYINVKNGLYDLEAKTLVPHTPEVISTIQLNCSYPDTYHPPDKWIQFMCSLCLDEKKQIDTEMYDMVQEWLGLIFSNIYGYRAKRALTLYSAIGNTGKSVLITVCTDILGAHNVVNVTFQEMDGGRWATGRLLGVRLAAVGDQGSGDLESSSIFKQLTGGDMVSAEFKGKQGFDFTFTGVILVACNILPVFMDDKGDHMFQRLEFANCRNVIPEPLQDKTLAKKLSTEADQIFRWALDGLHRFIDNNYSFTACKSGQELKETYREEIDPLYKFVREHCDVTGNMTDRILRSEFNNEYFRFCSMYEHTPMKKKNIPKRALKQGISEGKIGQWYYKGVKWKELRPELNPALQDF